MGLDIRIPVGLMFGIIGIILVVYGVFSDPAIYQASLGINVNLWWGLCLVIFGVIMFGLGYRKRSA